MKLWCRANSERINFEVTIRQTKVHMIDNFDKFLVQKFHQKQSCQKGCQKLSHLHEMIFVLTCFLTTIYKFLRSQFLFHNVFFYFLGGLGAIGLKWKMRFLGHVDFVSNFVFRNFSLRSKLKLHVSISAYTAGGNA